MNNAVGRGVPTKPSRLAKLLGYGGSANALRILPNAGSRTLRLSPVVGRIHP